MQANVNSGKLERENGGNAAVSAALKCRLAADAPADYLLLIVTIAPCEPSGMEGKDPELTVVRWPFGVNTTR